MVLHGYMFKARTSDLAAQKSLAEMESYLIYDELMQLSF